MESKEDKLVLGDHPKEIKNPYHIHPFEFKNTQYSVRGHTYSERCRLCHEPCPESYYCKPCNFYLCPTCVKTNPFVVDPRKTHDHQLTFVPKFSFVFTCDACGVGDQKSALCMCIPCSFAIHLGCVSLPRVICINRHDEHRISLRLPLGSGDWICKLCLEKVNGEYGAYSCLTCSDYVVHSKCATHYRVWDGIDLDGVPEEDPEEIMPFKVVEEGVINYFGHEHNLRLAVFEEGETRNKQCSACVLPIYSNPCYVCTDHCDFILHEVCANFLKKKRHPVDPRRFTLSTVVDRGFGYATKLFCKCCNQIINGFYYEADSKAIDVLCASFKDGYVHASHPHLGLVIKNIGACSNCERERSSTECYSMACNECKDFKLCYRCLTLPEVVEHKYDEEHPLSLCYGENNSGSIYWCELCEGKLDPSMVVSFAHQNRRSLMGVSDYSILVVNMTHKPNLEKRRLAAFEGNKDARQWFHMHHRSGCYGGVVANIIVIPMIIKVSQVDNNTATMALRSISFPATIVSRSNEDFVVRSHVYVTTVKNMHTRLFILLDF
ncbi:unnamed protein product [Cochlearia groenlandica]